MASTRMLSFTLTNSKVEGSGWESIGFTPQIMFISITGGNVRYSFVPNQEPTTGYGHRFFNGASLLFNSQQDVKNFKMIAESSDVQVTITHKAG